MAILDKLTPTYYTVLNMGIQQEDSKIEAAYDIAILNARKHRIAILSQSSTLTVQEKQAIVAIFLRDKAQFEAATGLEEWIPPE